MVWSAWRDFFHKEFQYIQHSQFTEVDIDTSRSIILFMGEDAGYVSKQNLETKVLGH